MHTTYLKEAYPMLNIARLNEAIVRHQLSIPRLADSIGISKSTFYRKLKDGGDNFMLWEIESMIKQLGLTPHEAAEIFLA